MKEHGSNLERGDLMKTDTKAFLASSCLHLLVVGSTISFAAFPQKPQAPILVDFTIVQEQQAESRDTKGSSAAPPPSASHIRSTSLKQTQVAVATPIEMPPLPAEPVVRTDLLSTAAEAVPVVATMTSAQTHTNAPSPSGGVTAVQPGKAADGGRKAPGGTGTDSSANGSSKGENAETLRKSYMRKHFAYIRDQVAANLRYPGLARRMGWSGKLTIEFIVQKDGTADTIRVVSSSGVSLLDRDARDTVIRSAPFPKPPVSAKLVIPVEYHLED